MSFLTWSIQKQGTVELLPSWEDSRYDLKKLGRNIYDPSLTAEERRRDDSYRRALGYADDPDIVPITSDPMIRGLLYDFRGKRTHAYEGYLTDEDME